ncbi:MAG: NAD(P)/FAD-dependent oxidoreductase [Acidobacteriota bacterium]|nr:NAD(P)/FAD-dependent oxidoreductase [Acidobacteriota bacterium]
MPSISPDFSALSGRTFDIAVIGGGVVGCAVLRELSRFELRVLLLEKESDLAEGMSKANSGVIHAGFNLPPGTLKAAANAAGLGRIYELAAELGVPHRKTGKLVVAFDDADLLRLEELLAQGRGNGTPGLEIIGERDIGRIEPHVRGKWALLSPWTGIISPYAFTTALAECALRNGADVLLETAVTGVDVLAEGFELTTPRGKIRTRWVVNSAGLFSAEVAALAGITDFVLKPYRGEYLVSDKAAAAVLSRPVYPVPPRDDSFLGVHITPTLDGNILLGPSSEPVEDCGDTATTRAVMDRLKAEAFKLVPALAEHSFIRSYSGLRPRIATPDGRPKFADFVFEESEVRPGWINLIGIESPGLTAAPAIAAWVGEIISGREARPRREDFDPVVPAPLRFAERADPERRDLVAADGDWGEMVCRCEHVTRAEVEAALDNPFGVRTLDGIKRRTRCGMGRCQGGFCTPRLVEILQRRNVPLEIISKRGPGSELFPGRIKP